MLQELRGKLQSVVAYVIIALLILSFGLWGVSRFFGGSGSAATIAKVNGQKVTYQQFMSQYREVQSDAQKALGAQYHQTPEVANYLKQQTLQKMIGNIILNKNAYGIGLRAGSDLVNDAIYNIPALSREGHFAPDILRRYLAIKGIGFDQFQQQIKNQLIVGQLTEGLANTHFSLPYQVNLTISIMNEKRDIVYTQISADQFATPSVSDEQAKQYYDEHQDEFKQAERVQLKYVTLSKEDVASTVVEDPVKEEQFYQLHQSDFIEPAKWQILRKVVPIENNDLAAAKKNAQEQAKVWSNQQDTSSEPQWITSADVPVDIANGLATHTKAGDMLEPVLVDSEYVIYKVIAYRAAVTPSFESVRDQVRQRYLDAQVNAAFSALIDEVTNLAYEQPDSLAPIAKLAGVSVHISDFVERAGSQKGFTAYPQVLHAAFSDEVLVGNNNSDLIELDKGHVAILRINEHQEAKLQAYNEVKTAILKQLKSDQQLQAAKSRAEKIQQQLMAGESLDALTKQYGVTFHDLGKVGRFENTENQAIISAGFGISFDEDTSDPVATVTAMPDRVFAVVAVTLAALGDPEEESDVSRQRYAERVAVTGGHLINLLYAQSVYQSADIDINEKMLDQV